jgi:acyl-CoA thioesterase
MVDPSELIDFEVEVVHAGRTMGSALVRASQRDRTLVTVSVLLDKPSDDVIRHEAEIPEIGGATNAHERSMPMIGRELRMHEVVDPNDPDEVGPPFLDAWLHYDPIPERDDLRKALLAHYTGHLSISTTMRPHAGVGTAQAHVTISTGVMAIQVSFHEPVTWDGWILYHHESTAVGSGMSYVRGQVFSEEGHLLASFSQDGMIRPMAARTSDSREVKHRL